MQRGVWAALLCAVLCVLLCGCQSAAEPETMEVQEPAIQAASVPEPEPEPEPEYHVHQNYMAASDGFFRPDEPLRRAETNILNTQPESLALVQSVGHPHFKLLCDYYHLVVEGGTPEMVAACGDALRHVHISNPDGRVAMKPDDKADYKAFFDALRRAGYDARVSFEGSASDYKAELPAALEVLRNA